MTTPVNDVSHVILTFDTVVRGFDAADIRVQNGTATAPTGSGTLYTVTITPDGTSAIVISVDLTGVTDRLGNAGTSTETLTVAYYDSSSWRISVLARSEWASETFNSTKDVAERLANNKNGYA